MESSKTIIIHKENFFEKTKANFIFMKTIPSRPPDFVSGSGSFYWHGTDEKGDYVIRYANHWTGKLRCKKIKDCIWTIDSNPEFHKGFEIIQLEKNGHWTKKKVQKRVCGICWFKDITFL